jgi:hypothetical protein
MGYVAAGYIAAFVTLGGYAMSLRWRSRHERD